MKEVFEKIIEKLNSKKTYFQGFYECEGKTEHDRDLNKATQLAFDDAIEIVKQEGEKMRIEVFEKIIDKLEKERLCYFLTIANTGDKCLDVAYEKVGGAIDKAIEIFKQEGEQYNKELMEELIEAKKKCGEDSDCSECIFGKEEDRCYLQDLQISNKNSEWIPCSERLPQDGVDVLVWFEYFRYGNYNLPFQTTGISFTYNGKWSGFINGISGWSQSRIIAWQPLPGPYKEKKCD